MAVSWHAPPRAVCFYCGDRDLYPPLLVWRGITDDIYLHPACWVDIAARLFRDYHEVQLWESQCYAS